MLLQRSTTFMEDDGLKEEPPEWSSERSPKKSPSKYELKIIEGFQKTRVKKEKPINKWLKTVQEPFEKAATWLKEMPGIETIATKTKDLINSHFEGFKIDTDVVEQVIVKYQSRGFKQITQPEDITELHLEDIDPLVKDICQKYQSLANEDEEESTSISLQSMPKDIVALVNLNREAVSEYAAHYGFDISLEKERLFALSILEYAATNNDIAREGIMSRLIEQTMQMAGEDKDKLSKAAFLSMFSTLSSSISIKLLKAKVGEGFPVHGAVIGSGFNAYFTNEVCTAAQFFYKQRFLAKKYGSQVLEIDELKSLNSKKD